MIRLYTVRYSSNTERVSLALAHKGLKAEEVLVPNEDRSEVRKVSGQDLVPVLVDGRQIVYDSMEIVRYLEERYRDRPRLYPEDPARRAECLIFIDWFNRVWKRPPNEIADEMGKPPAAMNRERIQRLGEAMQGTLDLFEQLLSGRDYLMGEYGAADMAAFPFLKYAVIQLPDESYLFHRVLKQHQKPGQNHPRLVEWIARVDRRPRA